MKCKSTCALIARVILGGIFILAGWMKVADMTATVGFFAQLGIPAFLAYAVSYLELIGGVALVLGIFTDISSAILGIIMIFAIWFSRSAGMQGIMAPLAILGGLVSILGAGAGSFAVRFKKKDSAAPMM